MQTGQDGRTVVVDHTVRAEGLGSKFRSSEYFSLHPASPRLTRPASLASKHSFSVSS